ncbi:MAG: acyl-CoA thioesterase [Ignavibacteria bacterium]|nr:acyl-CoA thioesterase [Ignavibacteria bacterium]
MMKPPAESTVIMTELVLPNDTNQLGNLLGGRLMHWIDIAAALSAQRHASKVCVTASVDEISFNEPIRLGHVVHIRSVVTRSFRTSMEVLVEVEREDPLHGSRAHTSTAYLTFVAIDQYGRPLPANGVDPQTEDEKRRFEEASIRREARLREREAISERRK